VIFLQYIGFCDTGDTVYSRRKTNGDLPDKRAGGKGKFGVTNARSDDVTNRDGHDSALADSYAILFLTCSCNSKLIFTLLSFA
jgi:hypothetical protein